MSNQSKPRLSPHLTAYMNAHEVLASAFPSLMSTILDEDNPFDGITMFLGDNANVVVGLRRWGADGVNEVMWSSGDDFIAAMLALSQACNKGKWKVNKRKAL